jgi:hypothetical protein
MRARKIDVDQQLFPNFLGKLAFRTKAAITKISKVQLYGFRNRILVFSLGFSLAMLHQSRLGNGRVLYSRPRKVTRKEQGRGANPGEVP